MKVIYVGPHTAVDVPLPAGGAVTVEHGKELDTTKEHAESLLEQKTNWQPARVKRGEA